MKNFLLITSVIIFAIHGMLFFSCANPQPPSGGDEDKIPPVLIASEPVQGEINYHKKYVSFEFDEYVDHRSFEESFFISPKPKGKREFNWSGKSVDVIFEEGFRDNTTYNVSLGKGLKDIRAGNTIQKPISFAFSTGNKIDNCSVSGHVYSENFDKIVILAYQLNKSDDSLYNPEKHQADFIAQTDEKGIFVFHNLPVGKYRMFSLRDNDFNLLYDHDFEEISVLPYDIYLKDSVIVLNVNFLMMNLSKKYSSENISSFYPIDSTNIVKSNIKNNETDVPVDNKYSFYLKNKTFSRVEIADNIFLKNIVKNENINYTINWKSDSLIEISPVKNLEFSSEYIFDFNYKNTKIENDYKLKFKTAGERKYLRFNGFINDFEKVQKPVILKLFNSDKNSIRYKTIINSDSIFTLNMIFEGNYTLFAFIDKNNTGEFISGKAYPYEPSEYFILINESIKLKGGMSIENYPLRFNFPGN